MDVVILNDLALKGWKLIQVMMISSLNSLIIDYNFPTFKL